METTLTVSRAPQPRPGPAPSFRKAGSTAHDMMMLGHSTIGNDDGINHPLTMLKESVGLILLLAVLSSGAFQYDPKPNPDSVVKVGQARFTVLTSHLIRMEWGETNDAATFAFINRNLPAPHFSTSKDGDWTVIQTTAVTVRFC